jgi:predicted Zn-dependent peptidase
MLKRTLAAAGALALSLGVVAVTGVVGRAEQAAGKDPKIGFDKYTLDNGLEVVLHRDNRTPIVFVSVWYHVGSGDETPGKSGFAHLFEHMMFQGTKNTGEDRHFAILQEIGASTFNGTTSADRTNYFEQVPSNQLETALWLESERMGYLLPAVSEKSLKNQIGIVRNERRQRLDNQPGTVAFFKRLEVIYPEGHPYRYSTIGRHEELESANLDDVKAFFKKWYVPSNATLVIAGDIDPAETKALVQKWFGGFPKTAPPTRRSVPTPTIDKTRRLTVEDPFAKLPILTYVWIGPAAWSAGEAEMSTLAWILGNDQTGRLYRRLVDETQLAQGVGVGLQASQRNGEFIVSVILAPGADVAAVDKIVREELDRAKKEPVTDAELRRGVLSREARFVRGLETVVARAEELQRCNHYTGDPDCSAKDLARFRALTPQMIQAVAAQVLGKARIESLSLPQGGK